MFLMWEAFGEFCSQGHIRYLRMVMCCFSLPHRLVRASMIGIENRSVCFFNCYCKLRSSYVL